MEFVLPRKDDDRLMHKIVNMPKMDDEGKAVGNMNNNPLLDTRAYKVEFSDGTTEVLTTYSIVENLSGKINDQGHRQIFLDNIIDHRQDVNAIEKENIFTEK